MTTRFRMVVEYDGRPFMGFQFQAHGPSVQASLERAVQATTGEAATIVCAGRTDAGVHAKVQVVHVDVAKNITPFKLMEAMNFHLRPDPVAVLACDIPGGEWHARFSATARHYRYRIIARRAPLTWDDGLAWRVPMPLNVDAMHDAAQILVGKHDFTTFRSVQCQSDSPVRTLDRLSVTQEATPFGDEIIIEASARSFLHHQVRSMTGCLKLVGEGQWTPDDLHQALEAKDRAALGLNAPPDGLYFMRVDY
jgi:tRNA pseudouridine38-40 synthase